MAQLGITRPELARRLGYANLNKGLRQIDRMMAGGTNGLERQLERLPAALELDPSLVLQAINDTREQTERLLRERAAAAEASWRASFKPHAIVLTEHTVPSQVTICGMVGGERVRWIDLDLTRPRATFITQAVRELESRLAKLRTTSLPFFGRAVGFVVNLTPDCAVRYTLSGEAEAILPHAYRLGRTQLQVLGRPVSQAELDRLLGTA